jgi:hypothetical protein
MNRRPKLSLVSNRELNKKQALNFETDKRTGAKQSPELEVKGPDAMEQAFTHQPAKPELEPAGNRQNGQPGPSYWPSTRLLTQAVIVVVTVALSVYLVKRRLL